MDSSDAAAEAAQEYERLHVNALFGQWAEPMLDAAKVHSGQSVLDVACGTGVLARAAYGRVEPAGTVAGLDIEAGMLAVARSIEPGVTWIEGEAGNLPFDDAQFNVVVSQFGLMFFPDPVRAVREMLRCLRPGGLIAVAVWDRLEHSQAYSTSVDLLERTAGRAAADALRAPFAMGETDDLRAVFENAEAVVVSIDTQHRTATFPSVRSMVEADLRGWLPIMGVPLEDDVIDAILLDAEDALREYKDSDGAMVFDAPAHILVAHA